TIAMVKKYFDGKIPAASGEDIGPDSELKALAASTAIRTSKAMENLHVADALDEIWTLLRRSNKYIDETTPWILAKNNETERLGTVLYNLIESIRIASVLLKPYLPETGEKIQAQIGTAATDYESSLTFGATVPGTAVSDGAQLFARIDEKAFQAELEAEKAKKAAELKAKEELANVALISIDEFSKIDLRVAKVKACEPIPKAKKLLKLTVEVAGEERTVVSGIAQWYKPEDLIGRNVIIVSNLQPVVLRGVESRGMILAADAEEDDVKVIFADDIPSGAKVR
ncbi:MAG: methionine--tRNA ligase subunit beta, partial [Clostridiales bacterium]|nr:methionine--tRNA ligase subunit beta [Clostridiales bacterium]